ncbi:hypothetical protein HHL16_17835 [Pseudoflavitalea sp. G-6-1-2]|uniref:hypothetical protein n=1 Tax=Pseudoflavitalea sp. G-6-1-2 TaxID=2728841 RepID=UPI00146AE9EB|nr:hypothetical protein [Pseudoflavitalea sp. G-6-1-2]NML22750.1 hypothetical protein [Pseudoflavitalea sp. G-6-1-2]
MKSICFLLLVFGLSAAANAQQGKTAVPLRTSDVAPKQNNVNAALPIRKADVAAQSKTTTTAIPMRKTDISGSAVQSSGNNKTTVDNTKTQLPSDAPVPKRQPVVQSKKE